ncbi:MAG: hypothetical protein IIB37_10065 [Gemmatimonadetes bacterium]|nr:hypothetical protein [Gemmatimonadota bacterium]
MTRRILMAFLAVMIAAPLAAQTSAGLQLRLDRSTDAADPDDVPDVTVADVGGGFQINTGPAVTAWNSDNTASGTYTLSGTFTMIAPSSHVNYYGLVYGAGGMEGSGQNYLYFLVAQNGTYIVKHRAGDETTHDIQGRTQHEAIATPDASGRSVNALEVRVGADATQFVVNGVVVFTAPKTGMAARTDGIWGVRVNHVIPGILVEGLGVTD